MARVHVHPVPRAIAVKAANAREQLGHEAGQTKVDDMDQTDRVVRSGYMSINVVSVFLYHHGPYVDRLT